MEKSPLFNARVRKVLKNFGPALVILGLTVFNAVWLKGFKVATLAVPSHFELR